MADETSAVTASRLRDCLQVLSQDEGIQRPNLLDVLNDELKLLREIFGITLENGLESARKTLEGSLYAHIVQLTPRQGRQYRSSESLTADERHVQYRYVVMTSFNIPLGGRFSKLQELKLQGRRAWFASDENKKLKVSIRTSQRIFDHAVDQIVNRIISGTYTPPPSDEDLAKLIPDEHDESSPPVPSDSPPADNLKERSSKKRAALIGACLGAVLLLLVALATVLTDPFHRPPGGTGTSTSDGPDPLTTSSVLPTGEQLSIQLSPFDFHTGQATSPDLVVPEPLSGLERPPVFDGQQPVPFNAWAAKHKAVYAERMSVRFVVRSGATAPFFILGATPKVVGREAPLTGTWIAPEGGGPQEVRQLYVDLDTDRPNVTRDGNWEFPLRVSESEPEMFTVVARTKGCHCTWVIDLVVQLPNGEIRTVTVDNNGEPFELTSTANTTDKAFLPFTDRDPWPR